MQSNFQNTGKKRVLVLASVASMIDQFNMPNIKLLQELGYHVDVACNFICGSTCSDEKVKMLQDTLTNLNVDWYQIDFERSITEISGNIKAFKQVKRLIHSNGYEFIHCHSPIGGVVGRLAGKITRTKVIYTAHGFHFYKGAPLKNWLLYYPVEKICSHFTDVLICINKEDYALAQRKMRAKKTEFVPGIGIELDKFNGAMEGVGKREEIGIPKDMLWMLSVGELIPRKNHESLIKVVAKFDNIFLTIAGRGELFEHYQELIEHLNVQKRVKLLGFRTDVMELCREADVFAFPSLQEGLPVALMEAMASGLPILCSSIRGNTDLVENEIGGYLFNPYSEEALEDCINKLQKNRVNEFGKNNKEKIKEFSLDKVLTNLKRIYESVSI